MSFNKPNGQSFSELERAALKEYFERPRIKAQEQLNTKERAERTAKEIVQRHMGGSNAANS